MYSLDCSKACQKLHWTDGGHKKRCRKLDAQVQAAKARAAAASQSKRPNTIATTPACSGTSAAGGAASGSQEEPNPWASLFTASASIDASTTVTGDDRPQPAMNEPDGDSDGHPGASTAGSDNTCPICLDNPDDYERFQGTKYVSKGLCYNCGQVRAEQALALRTALCHYWTSSPAFDCT